MGVARLHGMLPSSVVTDGAQLGKWGQAPGKIEHRPRLRVERYKGQVHYPFRIVHREATELLLVRTHRADLS